MTTATPPALITRWLRTTTCTGSAVLSGCTGVQSALHPAGPAAAGINQLWWIMAVGATAILLLVMGLLWYTLARRQDRSEFRHGTRLVVFGGLIFPTVVLSVLLVFGTQVGRRALGMGDRPELVVEVEARRWFWTFHYLDADGVRQTSAIDSLTLPVGRTVEFRVTSPDVIHSFWIPRLNGKIDAIPGRVNVLRMRADTAVRMRGQCAEFCGVGHAHMAFDVTTLPAAEFDRWLGSGDDTALSIETAAPESQR